MQDDAGVTPETPRWTVRSEGRFWHVVDSPPARREYRLNNYAEATWLCKDLNHLEGALREAEQQRDVAIAQAEEWFGKAEEGYRVVTGMWEEALRETGKDAVAAIESLSPKLDAAARYVSDLQAKLREAETKWHRAEMQILEDADELDLLREAEAKAAGYKQSVEYALDRFGAIGSMSDWTDSDLSDATQEARDAAGTLKRNVRLLEQPRAGEIR